VAIAEGKAKIVTAFDELINDLRDIPYSLGTEFELTALQQRVLDALHGQPITVNRAGLKAGTTASETMRALGELQALGFAIESRGGWRKELSGSA
jgi:predicted Rossmann fold nucleotide-binding protein DprA/Smf involved in DNA uptake